MATFSVAQLEEITVVQGTTPFRPVRQHFGIMTFGVNTMTSHADGDRLIGEHEEDEPESGEELYVIISGHAWFETNGETQDAPTRTLVHPRQRAAFLLCDVLDRTGAEAAAVLGVSIGALKSLLQRARAALEQHATADEDLAEPTDERARSLLDRYVAAFEQSDMAEIERLVADDAILEMPGTTTWFSGKATCVPFIAAQAIGQAGDWRMVPVHANGQLAVAAYQLDDRGSYEPFAIVVLATHITLFGEPAVFSRFGQPAELSA